MWGCQLKPGSHHCTRVLTCLERKSILKYCITELLYSCFHLPEVLDIHIKSCQLFLWIFMYFNTSKQAHSRPLFNKQHGVMYFLNSQRRDNEVLMLIRICRQFPRQVNINVWTNLAFCDNQRKARCCQNRQCIIILFHLAYGGCNLQKCFTWGMCSRRGLAYPLVSTFEQLRWLTPNVPF